MTWQTILRLLLRSVGQWFRWKWQTIHGSLLGGVGVGEDDVRSLAVAHCTKLQIFWGGWPVNILPWVGLSFSVHCVKLQILWNKIYDIPWLGPLSEAVTNNWTREQGGMDCPSVIVIVNVFQIFLSILFPEKWKTPRCGQSRKYFYLSHPFSPPHYSRVEAFSPFISKDRIWGEKCVRGWRIGKLEWILCKFTKSFYHVLQVLELGSNIVFSIDQHLWAATKIM